MSKNGWSVFQFDKIVKSTELGPNLPASESNDGLVLIKMGNLLRGELNFNKIERIEKSLDLENEKYLLRYGDFLFNTRNTPEMVGKSVAWNKREMKAIFNSNIMRIYFADDVNPFYLSYYFSTGTGWSSLKSISTGTTSVGAIYTKDLMGIDVELPPRDEQNRIVEILTSVDRVIELTSLEIDKLKDLKKGMMQELLTKGIGHTKFKDSPVGKIPESWNQSTFGKFSKVRQGLQIAITERFKENGPNRLKYITNKYLSDKLNTEYIENSKASVICKEEDVLMTRTGNTGQVVTNAYGVFHNNFFLIDFNRDIILKEFLVYFLNSDFIQKIIQISAGSTTIPDLNHGDFYKIPILIPTMEEQIDITKKLVSIDNLIEAKFTKKLATVNLKKGLMNDLLTGEVRVKV